MYVLTTEVDFCEINDTISRLILGKIYLIFFTTNFLITSICSSVKLTFISLLLEFKLRLVKTIFNLNNRAII